MIYKGEVYPVNLHQNKVLLLIAFLLLLSEWMQLLVPINQDMILRVILNWQGQGLASNLNRFLFDF